MVGTLVLLHCHLHTIPTHDLFPSLSFLTEPRFCWLIYPPAPPPFYASCDAKGSWPTLLSLRMTHHAYQQLVQIGHVFQLGLMNVERFCWSLLGSTLSKIRAAGSLFLCLCLLSFILWFFPDLKEEAWSPACLWQPSSSNEGRNLSPAMRGAALKSYHWRDGSTCWLYCPCSEAQPTFALPECEPVNVLEAQVPLDWIFHRLAAF